MAKKEQNIFDYAKKELSQDAVITCILNEKDNNVEDFIRSMLGKGCPKKFTIEEVQNQVSKIDVLVTIKVPDENGEHCEAIIIEDKTNTFLHGNQLEEYINKVEAKKIQKKPKYKKIYFVLFKTGDYYFWEKDKYDKLQTDYKGKHSEANVCFKTYLLSEFITFLDKTSFSYGWIGDYRAHIARLSAGTSWCTDLTKVSDDFVKKITDGKWVGGSKNYEFGKADGNGDKGYELWLQGLCGSCKSKTVKDRYYLLPIVCLPTKNKYIVIKFNIHLNLNPKNPHGYLPLGKCKKEIGSTEWDKYKKLQEQVITDYSGKLKGFIFTDFNKKKGTKKEDFLQICSCKVSCDVTKYADVVKKIQEKLPALIDIVDEIDKKIKNGNYDYILI